MSWSSRRVFGLLVGAMVATSALVGCAGDATVGPDPGTPFVPANGGVTQNGGTSNETRAASENPQQVQVTVNGNPQTGSLPGGISLTAGEPVAVIEGGTLILQGMTVVGGRTHQPGDIMVRRAGSQDYAHSGVFVRADGSLSGDLVLPDGDYDVFLKGPFAVVNGNGRLDIQSIVLHGQVRNGVASVPTTIDGQLPVNGGTSYPLRLNIQMPAQFAAGFVELKVIHGNGILRQVKTLNNGFAQFHDLEPGTNSNIPTTGVQTVEFRYSSSPID
jgi:hypothetical protein